MTGAQTDLELRPAFLADAQLVADLESARTPDEPRDPAMLGFWWTVYPPDVVFVRMLAERNGSAIAYLHAAHEPWQKMPKRYGTIRLELHPELWTEARYERLVDAAESWLRAEGGAIGVVRVREDFENEIRTLERRGYREERRGRQWELNLVTNRERLLAGAELGRERMRKQGVQMLTLDRDADPDRLRKLYEVS